MREQLERLIAWAREHPWLAAVIVGGVVFLGYLAYKRSASSGSQGEMFQPSEASDQPSDTGLGFSEPSVPASTAGGGFNLPIPATAGGEVTTPYESMPAIPAAQPFQFSAPSFDNAYSTFGLTGSQDFASYASAPVPAESRLLPAIAPKVAQDIAAVVSTQTPEQQALGYRGDLGYAPRVESVQTTSAKKPTTAIPKIGASATAYGKGKKFTGYVAGVGYFTNGKLTSFLPPSAPKIAQSIANVVSTQTAQQQALGYRGNLGYRRTTTPVINYSGR